MTSFQDGGAERVVVNLARGFCELGHDVDVVLARVNPESLYTFQAAKYGRIVDLNAGRTINALLPLSKYLRQEKPQYMISHMTECNIISLVARKLARSRVRIAVVEHNVVSKNVLKHRRLEGLLIYQIGIEIVQLV